MAVNSRGIDDFGIDTGANDRLLDSMVHFKFPPLTHQLQTAHSQMDSFSEYQKNLDSKEA